MANRHRGSNFDEFLQEEGLLIEAEATAVKRVFAYQIEQEMESHRLSRSALARRMQTSRSTVDRLLDPENSSVTLLTLQSAALALGRQLSVALSLPDKAGKQVSAKRISRQDSLPRRRK